MAAGLGLHGHGTGVFIHWLPVDQGFTLEAGRTIWGFPKELAEIDLRLSSPYKRRVLRKDGRLVRPAHPSGLADARRRLHPDGRLHPPRRGDQAHPLDDAPPGLTNRPAGP